MAPELLPDRDLPARHSEHVDGPLNVREDAPVGTPHRLGSVRVDDEPRAGECGTDPPVEALVCEREVLEPEV